MQRFVLLGFRNLDQVTGFPFLCDGFSKLSGGSNNRRCSFAAQTHTTFIKLLHCNRENFSIPILQSLETNTSVKKLKICDRRLLDAWTPLQRLVERNQSMQRLEFRFPDQMDAVFTEPLAQSLIHSDCITDLSFQGTATYPHQPQGYAWVKPVGNLLRNKRICIHYAAM